MLKQRLITALILAPIVIGGFFFLNPVHFAWFTGAIIALGAWEWANLSGYQNQKQRVGYAALMGLALLVSSWIPVTPLLALAVLGWGGAFMLVRAYPAGTERWGGGSTRLLMGFPVLVPAWAGLNVLRTGQIELGGLENNALLLLYVFMMVWSADVGAYFAGRAFGKRKLAPQVSPGKSWAGVYGGVAAVALLALIAGNLIGGSHAQSLLLLLASLFTTMVSVLGDLFESMLKRHRGIKDSSQLLPGHGGVLDRIDSLTAAIPVFAFLALMFGWLTPVAG